MPTPRRFAAAPWPAWVASVFARVSGRALPICLVGHQQQRRADGVERAGVGLLKALDDAGDLGAAGDVLAEEDHPGRLAVLNQRDQAGGRVQARVAVDHPLARQLLGRQRRSRRRRRQPPGRGRPD
jgi:hypothetical protein